MSSQPITILKLEERLSPREVQNQTKTYRFSGVGGDLLRQQLLQKVEDWGYTGRFFEEFTVILDEVIANGKEHACHFKPEKHFTISLIETVDAEACYLHLLTHFPGEGFDPRTVRLSPYNPDGSLHLGLRGRGHLLLTNFAEHVAYYNGGRDLVVIKRKSLNTLDVQE